MFVLNNRNRLCFGQRKKQQWSAVRSALDMRNPLGKPTKSSGHMTYHSTIEADVVNLHTIRVSTLKLSTCVMTPDVRYRLMTTCCSE